MSSIEKIIIHQVSDFESMRRAGALAAATLDYISPHVQEGVSTQVLNDLCHQHILDHGAVPAPLGYRGYPKSICTSIDDVICHGIPNEKVLRKGQILNIDVTVILDGWYGDSSRMYNVGPILPLAQKLIDVTYDCLMYGIEAAKAGNKFLDIGRAISRHAHQHQFSVVETFCGHGIGRHFHSAPNVLHFPSPEGDIVIEEGMFFTIEPMINIGRKEVKFDRDGWTARTKDGKLSAQFEHSIGITAKGPEIFTLSHQQWHKPPYGPQS